MEYSYVAYTEDKRLVKGRLTAPNDEMANNLLSLGGYQVVNIKPAPAFISLGNMKLGFTRIKPTEVIMFSRQLALLLESGSDIIGSLELLQGQITNSSLKKSVGEIAADIRGGSSLSQALSKHPKAFSKMYVQAMAAGEQSGNLEEVLRQMADYMERAWITQKKIKSALTYPIIVAVVAFIVIALLVLFVLPTFNQLYSSFGANMPGITQILLGFTTWLTHYGLYLIIGIIVAAAVVYAYRRSPAGHFQWDRLVLRLPVFGRIILLSELSRACRTISLLFKVGLPLPDIMTLAVQGSNNQIISGALKEVQEELIRGEGLAKPMSRRPIFLPLMVQMAGVGEETGNLDNTLSTVARSYESEAEEKTEGAVNLIQPAITVVIGLIVAFIALALISAMYGIYGQIA
jgi:type IV pilus assembly protein PilC